MYTLSRFLNVLVSVMSWSNGVPADWTGVEETTFSKSTWQNVNLWASRPEPISATGCRNCGYTVWQVLWCGACPMWMWYMHRHSLWSCFALIFFAQQAVYVAASTLVSHGRAGKSSWRFEPLHSWRAANANWLTPADETSMSCSSRAAIKWMLKPAVDILSDEPANLANLVVAGADCF